MPPALEHHGAPGAPAATPDMAAKSAASPRHSSAGSYENDSARRAAPDAAWPPDFIDRVFEYLLTEFPQIAGAQFAQAKRQMREEFKGEQFYVRGNNGRDLVREVLAHFNGENAREVARRLKVSRATVYRVLKQHGDAGRRAS